MATMTDRSGTARFAGYASVFNLPDRGRDVVQPNAFRDWLAGNRPDLPVLWQHEVGEPIGRSVHLSEDGHGLRVVFDLAADTLRGRDAIALLKMGAVSGLSIGYRTRSARQDQRLKLRLIEAAELVEISLVTFPMQAAARVIAGG